MLEKQGWNYVDLVEQYCDLDSRLISDLFIQENIKGYIWSKGHYSEEGNKYIAELLKTRLK